MVITINIFYLITSDGHASTPANKVEEAGGFTISQSLAGTGDNSRHSTYMPVT